MDEFFKKIFHDFFRIIISFLAINTRHWHSHICSLACLFQMSKVLRLLKVMNSCLMCSSLLCSNGRRLSKYIGANLLLFQKKKK